MLKVIKKNGNIVDFAPEKIKLSLSNSADDIKYNINQKELGIIAKEVEKSIVDIETLKKTNQDIIETLDTVIKIHEEGRIKRAEATKELENIEKELKDKLLEINVGNKKA